MDPLMKALKNELDLEELRFKPVLRTKAEILKAKYDAIRNED